MSTGKGRGISTRLRDRARLSEKIAKSTRKRLFLQSTSFDFLMVLFVATMLAYTVSFAFESAPNLRSNPLLIAGLLVPLLIALYVGTWSKRVLIVSVLTTGAVFAAIVIIFDTISPDPLFGADGLDDVPGNYTAFALVVCVVGVLTFLLSRKVSLLVLLAVSAIVACGAVQFMYREWLTDEPGMWAMLGVLLGIAMLFIYQNYKQSIYTANRVKRTSFFGAFGFSALISFVCVLVGVAVFFLFIAHLNFPTIDIRPIEEYVSPPIDYDSNSYSKSDQNNDDLTNNTGDEQSETDSEAEGNIDNIGDGEFEGMLSGSFVGDWARSLAGYGDGDMENMPDDLKWKVQQLQALIVSSLILAALILVIIGFIVWRAVRLVRLKKRSPEYQVWYLYEFLLKRFERLRIKRPQHLTPLEFAVGYEKTMKPFTRNTNVDFVQITSLYEDVIYGGRTPTEKEMAYLRSYYKEFFKNARKYVGLPRWILWKFWRM